MPSVEAGGMTHAGLLSEYPGSVGKLDPLEFLEPWRIPGLRIPLRAAFPAGCLKTDSAGSP